MSEVVRLKPQCPYCNKRVLAIVERRRIWSEGIIRYIIDLVRTE